MKNTSTPLQFSPTDSSFRRTGETQANDMEQTGSISSWQNSCAAKSQQSAARADRRTNRTCRSPGARSAQHVHGVAFDADACADACAWTWCARFW
jgi:hypothetical protein